MLNKKIKKLEKYLIGIENLNSLPGLVINFNQAQENIIIEECFKLKIPLINVSKTFSLNLKKINIPIILNHKKIKKMSFFLNQIYRYITFLKFKKKNL